MTKKKLIRIIGIAAVVMVAMILCLSMIGNIAYAAGLVDDTINAANAYSQYPLANYQLDFYVDNSWDWLPWNWGDGIGKSVMYGLYAITNFIWMLNLYISNATGYIVQEAYRLNFISDTANAIGKNIQILAGVSPAGFNTQGFYPGFLLILILIVGCYVAYTGLIKRETTKAIRAVTNFVVVFILSAAFIAYAPAYVEKINDFSSDISNAALSLGTKIVLPNSANSGKDSVDLIRDNLFAIQVQQPWLLLQYDSTDIESIGADRVEELLAISPDTNNGKDREKAVKKEIEDHENTNMSTSKIMNRLGTVVFLFFFNGGISIFVFLLTGIMIFSQILFIIYSMFLPISFLLSMIPTYEATGKRAITKLFNTMMSRAGITLIITVAFSVSTMFYSLSAGYPFFLIAFLQIVTFAGIYMKLGDLMGMFSLQSNDSQQLGRGISRRMQRDSRKMKRQIRKMKAGGNGGNTSNSKNKRLQRNPSNTKTGNSEKSERQNKTTEHAGAKKSADRKGKSTNAVRKDRNPDKVNRTMQQGANIKYQADAATWKNLKVNRKTVERKATPPVKQVEFREGNTVKRSDQSAATRSNNQKRSNERPTASRENRFERGLVPEARKLKQRETLLNGKPLPEAERPQKRELKQYNNTAEFAAKRQKRQVLLNGRPLVEADSSKKARWKRRVK